MRAEEDLYSYEDDMDGVEALHNKRGAQFSTPCNQCGHRGYPENMMCIHDPYNDEMLYFCDQECFFDYLADNFDGDSEAIDAFCDDPQNTCCIGESLEKSDMIEEA